MAMELPPYSDVRARERICLVESCGSTRSHEGQHLLHVAAAQGDAETVQLLLNTGTSCAHVGDELFNTTALHFACRHGQTHICEILMERGADVNAVNLVC
jgi:ankyrin repeat protein